LGTAVEYTDKNLIVWEQKNYDPSPLNFETETSTVGRIGQTKYLRAYNFNMHHLSMMKSFHPDSDQAWLGWNHGNVIPYSGAMHNQTILWNKITNVF